MNDERWGKHLLTGLKALADSAFPKQCRCCGRRYDSPSDFVTRTKPPRQGGDGIKPSRSDDGAPLLELYRNCVCGSTLMDFFNDRRDLSAAGQKRRETFAGLIDTLARQGWDRLAARQELLKALSGEATPLLQAGPGGAPEIRSLAPHAIDRRYQDPPRGKHAQQSQGLAPQTAPTP